MTMQWLRLAAEPLAAQMGLNKSPESASEPPPAPEGGAGGRSAGEAGEEGTEQKKKKKMFERCEKSLK